MPPSDQPSAVEVVARALMEHDIERNGWSDAFASGMRADIAYPAMWERFSTAALAALRAAGYAVVPVEPTDDMLEADAVVDARAYAVGEDSEGRPRVTYDGAAAIYRAMLSAAAADEGGER